MCLEKLICKEKLLCPTSGTSGEIVFSMVGHASSPLKYIAALLKTSGQYTLSVVSESETVLTTVTKQGTGSFEFCILSGFELTFPNIYKITFQSSESLALYEVNLASICLCDPTECV